MKWIQRKIYLYNVTFGLYMLDWWERCVFNILVLVLLWFISFTGFRYASQLFKRHEELNISFISLLLNILKPFLADVVKVHELYKTVLNCN